MCMDGVEIFTNGSGSHHELRKAYVRVDLLKSATFKVRKPLFTGLGVLLITMLVLLVFSVDCNLGSSTTFPLIFQSLCAQRISFVQHFTRTHVFGMTCMKYVQKHFWKEHLCVLQVFLCALVSRLLCACTRAQLTGNIGQEYVTYCLCDETHKNELYSLRQIDK